MGVGSVVRILVVLLFSSVAVGVVPAHVGPLPAHLIARPESCWYLLPGVLGRTGMCGTGMIIGQSTKGHWDIPWEVLEPEEGWDPESFATWEPYYEYYVHFWAGPSHLQDQKKCAGVLRMFFGIYGTPFDSYRHVVPASIIPAGYPWNFPVAGHRPNDWVDVYVFGDTISDVIQEAELELNLWRNNVNSFASSGRAFPGIVFQPVEVRSGRIGETVYGNAVPLSAERQDAWEAAGCTAYEWGWEPDPPPGWEPDPPPGSEPDPGDIDDCVGINFKCEDTQLEIRDLIGAWVSVDSVGPSGSPTGAHLDIVEFPDVDIGSGLDGPAPGDWSARVSVAVADLVSVAESKFPFGLGSWIPGLSVGGPSTSECGEIYIPLLGINDGIGWCDSSVHQYVSLTTRAGFLLIVLIAFYFSTARTVAWA